MGILVLFSIGSFFVTSRLREKQQISSQAATSTAILTLAPSTINVSPNQAFSLPISVILNTNGQAIVGADIQINFDNYKLVLTGITKETSNIFKTYLPSDTNGNFNTDSVIAKANNTGLVEFGISAFDFSANNGAGGTTGSFNGLISPVSKLTFQVKPEAVGTTTLSFNYQPGTLTDSNIIINPAGNNPQDVLAQPTSSVLINLILPTAIPLPTAAASLSETPIPPQTIPDNIPPSIFITNPLNNSSVFRFSNITITAWAEDNPEGSGIAKVEFYIDGKRKCTSLSSPYSCLWKIRTWKKTTYTIEVIAYDNAGNTNSQVIRVSTR